MERHYVSLMTMMAAMILFLNFHGQGMSGILNNYRGFKQIILSGFDPTAAPGATPTFPMWGYGWVFLLTENKLTILVAQNILAVFSIWFCFRLIEENKYLPSGALTLAKILIIAAVPWYAFHSLLWPYSIANSLLIITLCLFVKAIATEEKATYPILISGLLFGLALNFRSDYYLFPIGFIFIIGLLTKLNKQFVQKSVLWMTLIYLTLIPWGLYTKSVTGHYLITSTNAGAALYIGLGSFPETNGESHSKTATPKCTRQLNLISEKADPLFLMMRINF